MGAAEPTRVESQELDDQQRRIILERLDRRDNARAEVRAWLDNDCKAFEQAWLERWNALHAQPPECLYHYTTADGLRGTLESQTLWATDARFLNGASELSYANAIIAKVAVELIGQCGATIQQTFLNAASLDLLDTFKRMFGTYVVSFCGERNLLSQWRAYAPGAGYALGFDSNALKRSGPLQRLRPIIYEQAEQKAFVEEVLAFYVRELERFERGAGRRVILPSRQRWTMPLRSCSSAFSASSIPDSTRRRSGDWCTSRCMTSTGSCSGRGTPG